MAQGFVYILVSANSDFIKIGGTERPISERLRGINGTESYADHGPWQLSDFLHVTDWRLVEEGCIVTSKRGMFAMCLALMSFSVCQRMKLEKD